MAEVHRSHFVIAANRLPVDKHVAADGTVSWHRSPGGLVTAMEAVMASRDGVWLGWTGEADVTEEPFQTGGLQLVPITLTGDEIQGYYEGFSNDTLWPIYHDVIIPATFHRVWWQTYRAVNEKFADALAAVAAEGATVWVQDYQLQLVPALLRRRRPDLRIGWFNHIPFPPVELFAQLPWRDEILKGLLGADVLGFQHPKDSRNFQRACRQILGLSSRGELTRAGKGDDARWVKAAAYPISVDVDELTRVASQPAVQERAKAIRASLGDPSTVLLGVDRLDYTKGIRHRLKAYEELLEDGAVDGADTTLIQIAVPSRERIAAYAELKDVIESAVGRINGEHAALGSPALEYLHHGVDREEMAALYLAADVMLVTPLRDGMNLVAKEYVASRVDDGGALVLSEFTGAARELPDAYLINPHDIGGLKRTILAAVRATPAERRRRMRRLRRAVARHDVHDWARSFLDDLDAAPFSPGSRPNRAKEDL